MSKKPSIECKPDGPYLVRDLTDLRNSREAPLPVEPVMALCRCGGSKNKPFCDGTHKKIGFSGARLVDRSEDRREDYRSGRLVIHDNRSLCAHAGRCTDGLAAVFKYGSEPWIEAGGAPVEAVIATVRQCPSGALSCSIDGVEERDPMRAPAVTITKNGPYAIVGGVELQGQVWGSGASREHYTLCRCGGSKNKPFCDGTHDGIGFKDEKN